MQSLDLGSRDRVQTLKEVPAKGLQPQPTKGWTVTEELFNCLQLLLIATYPAIVRLESVPDPCQLPNLAVPCNKLKT